MDRRRFIQISAGTVLATALQKSLAETAPLFGSDEEEFSLDTILNEIEALGEGHIETVFDEIGSAAPQVNSGGIIVSPAIMAPERMEAVFPVPPIDPELLAQFSGRKYWALPSSERENPVWPNITNAPDYFHLQNRVPTTNDFILNSEVLYQLALRNSFAVLDIDDTIVFGLRGCQLPEDIVSTGWVDEQSLTAVDPTHLKLGCTLGLWRQADRKIALFRASTVPAVHYMFMSLPRQGSGTSLLPTGLYEYERGDHLASKPRSIQRGALRIQGVYPVLRTAGRLTYDPFLPSTAWTRGAAHNIHAAGVSDAFDSAGCQVIQGAYVRPDRVATTGAWDDFRKMAGTVDSDGFPPGDGQRRFQYMLLTGHEAALVYRGGSRLEGYGPLRFGSSGPRVATLQEGLVGAHGDTVNGLRVSGYFGMATSFAALIQNKWKHGDFISPISANV